VNVILIALYTCDV